MIKIQSVQVADCENIIGDKCISKIQDETSMRAEIHNKLCSELNETFEKKNRDYGNSFSDTYQKLGVISAVTRITDKYNRLVSLCLKPEEERKVKDESIRDTLMDMANYCIMTVMELERSE